MIWDLIVSVPDHCLSFYLSTYADSELKYKVQDAYNTRRHHNVNDIIYLRRRRENANKDIGCLYPVAYKMSLAKPILMKFSDNMLT